MVEEEDWFEDWIFILVVEDMSFLLGVEEEMVELVRFFFLCIVEGLSKMVGEVAEKLGCGVVGGGGVEGEGWLGGG